MQGTFLLSLWSCKTDNSNIIIKIIIDTAVLHCLCWTWQKKNFSTSADREQCCINGTVMANSRVLTEEISRKRNTNARSYPLLRECKLRKRKQTLTILTTWNQIDTIRLKLLEIYTTIMTQNCWKVQIVKVKQYKNCV